jgi:glycosyltransferase involved in cell wall biosynthesis
MSTSLHVHVPTPGDHYSPATGSAPMTIVYELARVHAERGGETRVIVGRGTRHDYPVGECVEVAYDVFPSRRRKLADAAVGGAGLRRRFLAAVYEPALEAVGADPSAAVLVHNGIAGASLLKQRRPHARTFLYAHNELLRTYGRREARRTLEALDGIVCVSEFLAERVRALAPSARVAVVRNGVDVARFRPGEPDGQGPPTILFVGRVVPEKGADVLVAAAVQLAARGVDFRLRLVGSHGFSATDPLTPYERRLRELASPLGGTVEFVPFVDRERVLQEYRSASVFCAPSVWHEPCSLTVPEALACGLPTVASRRGGLPEVGGDAVVYVDPLDAAGVADALQPLLEDERLRAACGRRAREHAETLSWQARYEDLVAALAEAA